MQHCTWRHAALKQPDSQNASVIISDGLTNTLTADLLCLIRPSPVAMGTDASAHSHATMAASRLLGGGMSSSSSSNSSSGSQKSWRQI
jgi:hypothetical protein